MLKIIIPLIIIVLLAIVYFRSNGGGEDLQQNIKVGADFLAKNKENSAIVETASGLQYEFLEKGEGTIHPLPTDKVKVHYHGTLIDGTVFDSSVERGTPISFGLNQVISGWQEGVQLMVIGDKVRFYIPANLAYGNRSMGKIKGGSTLIFEVSLLAINE